MENSWPKMENESTESDLRYDAGTNMQVLIRDASGQNQRSIKMVNSTSNSTSLMRPWLLYFSSRQTLST